MAHAERIAEIRKQLSSLLRAADTLDMQGKYSEADAIHAERSMLGSELDRLYAEEDAELIARVRGQICTGSFAGRFQVVRDGCGYRVFDTVSNTIGRSWNTESEAKKAANERARAMKAEDAGEREYQSMQRGTWKNRTVYAT